MAFTNFAIIVVFISMAAHSQAGYGWGNQGAWGQLRMPFAPILPTPPFQPFQPFKPFPPFSPSDIPMPTAEQMANFKPGPNQFYNGIRVDSTSHTVRDENGKVIHTGGSTVMTNDNGDTKIFTVGNNPPKVNTVNVPPMPDFEELPEFHIPELPPLPHIEFPPMPEFNQFDLPKPVAPKVKSYPKKKKDTKKFKPLKMKPLFEPIFKPVSTDEIKTYVPKENEEFVGYSSHSYKKSVNINGVEDSEGGRDVFRNINGNVNSEAVRYRKGDKRSTTKSDGEATVSDEYLV